MCPCQAFISQVVCSCPQLLIHRIENNMQIARWSDECERSFDQRVETESHCANYFLGKGLCSLFLSLHVIWLAEKMLRASDPCCISVSVTINQKAGSLYQQLFQIVINILICWGAFHYTRLTGHWANQKDTTTILVDEGGRLAWSSPFGGFSTYSLVPSLI